MNSARIFTTAKQTEVFDIARKSKRKLGLTNSELLSACLEYIQKDCNANDFEKHLQNFAAELDDVDEEE